jgi:4-hydroxythreonine-4-phosphate dehydrogenase
MMYKPIIAVTAGDPSGIGIEVSTKALNESWVYDICRPFIIGDGVLFANGNYNIVGDINGMRFEHGTIDVLDMGLLAEPPPVGAVCKESGAAAYKYIEEAIRLAMQKRIDAVATAPISKEALSLAGIPFPGHTEIFAAKTGSGGCAMLLAHGSFRVIHVSTHISLRAACDIVKKERVLEVIRAANDVCSRLWRGSPRIGVAGLNPHAGESGMFGREETDEIIPAIRAAQEMGINACGPLPPDTAFAKMNAGLYDIVVCMYHDQGHIPTKLLGFDLSGGGKVGGINMTVGLPIIRVSVDHGTAFDIAGKGLASAGSMLDAIKSAAAMAHKRLYVGEGAINEVINIINELQPQQTLIVTDDNIKPVVSGLNLNHRTITVNKEPTVNMLRNFMDDAFILNSDLIIAVGGGSVIDVAKLLAVAGKNPEFAKNPRDASLITRKGAYFVAVPTTAGTGAEATPNSILIDDETHGKVGIINKLLIADAVILDANLTATMPRSLALTTGLDALAHAAECLLSKKANVYSDFYAGEAIRLITENLLPAADGNPTARENMLLASHYAGVCLTSSSTCAVHAMAYPMSRYNVPHGAGIAMLLFEVMRVFRGKLGVGWKLGDGFMDWLEKVTRELNMKPTAYGIGADDYAVFAQEAFAIRRLMDNNPFEMGADDMLEIYRRL